MNQTPKTMQNNGNTRHYYDSSNADAHCSSQSLQWVKHTKQCCRNGRHYCHSSNDDAHCTSQSLQRAKHTKQYHRNDGSTPGTTAIHLMQIPTLTIHTVPNPTRMTSTLFYHLLALLPLHQHQCKLNLSKLAMHQASTRMYTNSPSISTTIAHPMLNGAVTTNNTIPVIAHTTKSNQHTKTAITITLQCPLGSKTIKCYMSPNQKSINLPDFRLWLKCQQETRWMLLC